MLISSKHFTPVIGLDIHIVILLGFPVPLPHPFIGLVIDPMDYVPFIGATTHINHVPRGKSDTSGMLIFLFHIPMGGPFLLAPMIGHESVNFFGSKKVTVEGNLMTPSGHMLMTCNDIGLPLSLTPGKKFKPIPSLFLPTSYSIPLSFGKPVNVGGPYVPDWAGVLLNLIMSFGFGSLMKGLGKAGKKALTKFNHALKGKIGSNKLSKTLCKMGFEPVDLVQGIVIYDGVDFELPGPIPLKWERSWNSDSTFEGLLGHGTHLCYDMRLQEFPTEAATVVLLGDGRSAVFDALPYSGNTDYNRHERLLLTRTNTEEYTLFNYENRYTYTFRQLQPAEKQYRLISISDERGFMISFHYNNAGHLLRIIDSAGRHLVTAHDEAGRLTRVTAHHQGKTREMISYSYNDAGDLNEITDPLGATTYLTYQDHLMVKKTDRNGHSFYWSYDEKHRCVHTTGDNRLLEGWLEYHPDKGYNLISDSRGTTTYYYRPDFVVTQIKNSLGHSRFYEYTDEMEVYREIDAEGNVTGYTYDDSGNRTSVVLPDGAAYTFLFDDQGRMIHEEDPAGNSRTYIYYKTTGLLHTITDANGCISIRRYNEQNLLSVVETENEDKVVLRYDGDYNIRSVQSKKGQISHWEYDAWGQCLSQVNPEQETREFSYDPLGRITDIRQPNGHHIQLAYNAYNKITWLKDGNHDIRFDYTPLGNVRLRDENGAKIHYSYNRQEELTGVVNEHGKRFRLERNTNGDIISETTFSGITRSFQYDSAGKIVRVQLPANRWIVLEYDSNGQIIRREYDDGTWEAFSYNRGGYLIEAANQHTTIKFQRDLLGRVTAEWQNGHLVSSVYNTDGLRSNVNSSLGAQFRFDWDQAGQLTGINAQTEDKPDDWKAHIERDLAGREIERYLPGDLRQSWQYQPVTESNGLPVSQQVTRSGHTIRSCQYLWDGKNQLKQISDLLSRKLTKFGYDAADKLSWAQYENGETVYRTRDKAGNLYRSVTRNDRKYNEGGQLIESGEARFHYDEAGNLSKKVVTTSASPATWEYRWYTNGMLKEVVSPDNNVTSFQYDALGRRTEKNTKGRITRFVWDGNRPLHEWTYPENDRPRKLVGENGDIIQSHPEPVPAENLVTWMFDEGSFRLSAKITAKGRYAVITDHIGTPCAAYDESGNSVWAADLDIYGKVRLLQGAQEFIPFRYQGQYEDEETGLYYNRFRYYDPGAGRYISPDPIGLGGGISAYSYVPDPTTQVDVFGLTPTDPFDDLAQLRSDLGMPNTGERVKDGVLTRLDVGDSQYYGINTWASSDAAAAKAFQDAGLNKPHSIFANHAEGDVLLQAFRDGGPRTGGVGHLYVDADVCGWCRSNINSVVKQLGLDDLIIHQKGKDPVSVKDINKKPKIKCE
nr:RHS repeat-associated core domain-containing protein [uncultured Chitinophaga sp.]